MLLRPFHLAFPVSSLEKARAFYGLVLGCPEGRSDTTWVDFNFFGHQLVFHLDEEGVHRAKNPVDGHHVPVPHFGLVLEKDTWEATAKKIVSHNISFEIEPYVRFAGKPGEQGTFFLYDYNDLALEFKYFEEDDMLFET